MLNFGEVLTKAWQITWKYKVLWIFGILAGCAGQVGSNNSRYSVDQNTGPGAPGLENLPPQLHRIFAPIQQFFAQLTPGEMWLYGSIFFVVGLLLVAILTVLSTVGRIGLVTGALKGDAGAERLTFGEVFASVKPFFWRVLGLNLLLGLVFLFVAVTFGIGSTIFTAITFGIGALCLLPLVCLLVPAAWLATIVIEQANIALIVDDLSIGEALRRGWEIFRANAGSMIILGLILFIGAGLFVGFIISLPLGIIGLPTMAALMSDSSQTATTGLIIGGICLVIYLPVLLVLAGIQQTFIRTSWTLAYKRLTASPSEEVPPVLEAPPASDAETF